MGGGQGLGTRSKGFGTDPMAWIREGDRKSGGVNGDFLKSGGGGGV